MQQAHRRYGLKAFYKNISTCIVMFYQYSSNTKISQLLQF